MGEELLAFAKSYLSEAFPNPRRIDCPPHSEDPTDADPAISGLLFPLLKEYIEILADTKYKEAG